MVTSPLLSVFTFISLLFQLILSLYCPTAAFPTFDGDVEVYVIDTPFLNRVGSLRGRSLTTSGTVVKKGARCNVTSRDVNICNGVSANQGKSILNCCKKHCRNTLGDYDNCGWCGQKCHFGQRCCHGTCTNVGSNNLHCGKCDNACSPKVNCTLGICGYA